VYRTHLVVEQRCERSTELGQFDDRRRFHGTDGDEQEPRRQRHFRQSVDDCRRPEPEVGDDELVEEVDVPDQQAGALRVGRQLPHQSLVRLNNPSIVWNIRQRDKTSPRVCVCVCVCVYSVSVSE